MTLQASVSRSWVQTVLAEAARQGLAEGELLAAAALPPTALARERWPIDDITRLWRAATRLTQDPSFGLKAGASIGPASLDVVGFVVQSAASLRLAIAAAQKYQALISDGGRLQLLAVGGSSWLIYHPRQGELAFSPQQIEAVLAAVVAAARWLTGRTLPPQRACFGHDAQGLLPGYRQALGCDVVEFGAAFSGLLLDDAVLDRPIPQGSVDLARLHETYAAEQLSRLGCAGELDELVLGWIARHLGPLLPSRERAAEALGIGPRTLARRLQERQTSFTALLDRARRDAALAQVAGTRRPFRDIAHDLGFAESSTFYRAFTRWCRVPPGVWRRQHRSAGQ